LALFFFRDSEQRENLIKKGHAALSSFEKRNSFGVFGKLKKNSAGIAANSLSLVKGEKGDGVCSAR
jgi:hypothetical protein